MDSDTRSPVEITAARLAAAGAFFAAHDIFGLAWIGTDLVVKATYGAKAGFVTVGRPVAESVTPLIGLEPQIDQMRLTPGDSLELPAVVIHTGPDHSARYNLSLLWSEENATYYLLVARADLNGTLEIELLRQVRARLMAEAETKAKSEALSRANRDLESFATVLSHDLQAPLRALRYAAGEASQALESGDAATARRQLDWIGAQTRRITSMMSGLLDYSSIGRKVEAIEPVDTHAVAKAIRDSQPDAAGYRVVVTGDWPEIDTLRAPLDLVLRNLVDNAIKHHDLAAGTITLDCKTAGDSLVMTVSDDGPGIPTKDQEAIFLPFRTLAKPGEPADGMGLGLALVRRTLESLGGGIRVISPVSGSRGTQFEIRWPRTVML